MEKLLCAGCGKKLLTYDDTSFRRYKSPVRQCKKCGKRYADPRCREIALEGIPSDIFSVRAYVFLMLFGGFFLYRGIYLLSRVQLGVPDEMQWLMPAALMIGGVVCIVGGIVEIILIKTGKKARKYERLQRESEQRLSDKSYAYLLQELGYRVPEKYL